MLTKLLLTIILSLTVTSINEYKVLTKMLSCEDNSHISPNYTICLVKIDVKINKEGTYQTIYTKTQFIGSETKKIIRYMNNNTPSFEIGLADFRYTDDDYYYSFDAGSAYLIDVPAPKTRKNGPAYKLPSGCDECKSIDNVMMFFFEGEGEKMSTMKTTFGDKVKITEIKDGRRMII